MRETWETLLNDDEEAGEQDTEDKDGSDINSDDEMDEA